jgi:hypothetical protein
MTYFLDFIKQSPSATYLVTTKKYTEKKYGTDELARRAAITEYHNEMKEALNNANVNYANALVRDSEGGILVMDIEGEYIPESTEDESEE